MQVDIRGGAYLSPAEMAHLTQNWAPYRSLGGKWRLHCIHTRTHYNVCQCIICGLWKKSLIDCSEY